MTATNPFIAGTVDAIPKRIGGTGREFNKAGADALAAILAVAGATASDGKAYETNIKARAAAGSAKRLVSHVMDGAAVKSRTYPDKGAFRWVIFVKAPEAITEAPAAE